MTKKNLPWDFKKCPRLLHFPLLLPEIVHYFQKFYLRNKRKCHCNFELCLSCLLTLASFTPSTIIWEATLFYFVFWFMRGFMKIISINVRPRPHQIFQKTVETNAPRVTRYFQLCLFQFQLISLQCERIYTKWFFCLKIYPF